MSGDIAYGEDAKGEAGTPVRLARAALTNLRDGDVLERAGGGTVRVIRDGEEIGRVEFARGRGDRWLLSQWMLCGGLGIGQ